MTRLGRDVHIVIKPAARNRSNGLGQAVYPNWYKDTASLSQCFAVSRLVRERGASMRATALTWRLAIQRLWPAEAPPLRPHTRTPMPALGR